MKIRHPVGRAGRMWLTRRRGSADRGRDLLERKRVAIQDEVERVEMVRQRSAQAWQEARMALETWTARAQVLAGPEQFDAIQVPPPRLTVRFASSFGVVYPGGITLDVEPAPSIVGGTSALDEAAAAVQPALRAALDHAAALQAVERLKAELGWTTRRLRAIERRWIPALADATRRLDLQLEERERDELVRARWALQRAKRGAAR